MIFSYKRKIFGFECDVYGHLNNASYLHFFEEARVMAMEETEYNINKLLDLGYKIFIKKIEIEYFLSVRFNEECEIKSYINQINKIKSTWIQEIYNKNNELCTRAVLYAVFIKNDKATRLTLPILEEYKSFLHKD